MEEEYIKAAKAIKQADYLVAFTGAGISAECGIPTFRGKDGLWTKFKPEEIATYQAFIRNPEFVWQWYIMRMEKLKDTKPSEAHKILAEWEKKGILKTVITQNVDELHQKAGSKNVIELHGNIWRIKCIYCDNKKRLKKLPKSMPRCDKCGNIMRPDVVWFGEALDPLILQLAFDEGLKSDVMIVIGTSGVVYPAGHIPVRAKTMGAFIIEINPEESAITPVADVYLAEKASVAMKKLKNLLSSL